MSSGHAAFIFTIISVAFTFINVVKRKLAKHNIV